MKAETKRYSLAYSIFWIVVVLVALALAVSMRAESQSLPDGPKPRPFFDRETIAEISLSAGALAADGYTTYAAPRLAPETNPLLRIDQAYLSRRGTSLYFGSVFAAEVGGMYAFRRHRWIKRAIPLAVTALEFGQAARNQAARRRP